MPVLDTSGLGPNGEPVTTTTQQVTPSTSASNTRKEMSPEAREQMRAWLDSLDAQDKANQSGPAATMPSAADVAADVASKENSQKALAKAEMAATPDPFDGAAPVPTIGGKPLMMPQEPKAEKVDRPFTSQEFGADPAMKAPQTYEAAKDEANAYKAQVDARVKREQAEQMAAAEAERLRLQQEVHARINSAAAEQAKAAEKLYEEPSAWSKILKAVAVGLGTYGAGLTRGPNYALEAIKEQNDHDMKLKQMRLNAAVEKIKAAGASQEQLEKFVKAQQERLIATSKAQIDAADARASAMLAPFPQAQREFREKMAGMKAENAAKVAKFVQDSTEGSTTSGHTQEGTKVTVAEGAKSDGRNTPTTADEYTNAEMMGKKAERGKELMKDPANMPTGQDLWDARNRQAQYVADLEAEKHGKGRLFINQMLRGGPGFPDSIYPENWSEQKKELVQLANENAHMVGVKRYGQTGMGGDHYLEFMGVMLGQPGEGEKAIRQKYTDLFDQSILNVKNYERLTKFGRQEDKASAKDARRESAPEPKPAAPKQRGLTAEDRQARDWAKANPRDPRAREILRKVALRQTVGE